MSKEKECRGCIGLSDEHTCTANSEFLELKRSFFAMESCPRCKAKDAEIERLEAEVSGLQMADIVWGKKCAKLQAVVDAATKHCDRSVGGALTDLREALAALDTDDDG